MHSAREAEWVRCAQQLGLVLRAETDRLHVVDNFGFMMRALGPPVRVGVDPVGGSWMAGHRGGTPVLVRGLGLPRPAFSIGRRRTRTPTTTILAAIDPPLLLGLRASTTRFLDLDPPPDVLVGHRALDDRFDLSAFDRARLAQVFHPSSGLANRLLATSADTKAMRVTDNIVQLVFSGVILDPARLDAQLQIAVSTARAFAAYRATLPFVEGEMPDRPWAAFAETEGMTFDRARMRITGEFRGIDAEVRLHTSDGVAFTTARATIPVRLGIDLRIVGHTSTHGVTSFGDFSDADIELGDPIFDDAFCIEASDPGRARLLLANVDLRRAALAVLQNTGELIVTDAVVSSAVEHPLRDATHITWLLENLAGIARMLGGGSASAGPYR